LIHTRNIKYYTSSIVRRREIKIKTRCIFWFLFIFCISISIKILIHLGHI
jgi:hypothetical protein